ncbi:hypothetical protein [Bombella saccharophila]|uniref:Uncharacterized protein n=1 Tax=Bombella saccharophila TaxID=2967338 RepID=A0ABT3W858_9PROT|nr:hypothetical protein [Bombella saccharophila]MCX5613813.1 hypothetical protein [Bombella saccharophila]PHI97445.1 hypothetical protein BG621_01330 [Parasaccharibacter apium]
MYRYRIMLGMGIMFLAGCTSHPTAREVAAAQHPKIQSFVGAPTGQSEVESSERVKLNLPSAPADTPLCGTALHEQASTGEAIYNGGLMTGNSCTRNACFQPLTGTFIAQNGTNSVCR